MGIGIGLTTAAVAAAGAYFLYGSDDAPKNRKKVKSWALKAKAEVLETLEDVDEMSQEEYEQLVESVSGAYARLKNASKADIATFKREMKDHWAEIERVAPPAKKMAMQAAAAVAKEVSKKTAKKAPKKATKRTAKKAAAKKTTKRAAKKVARKAKK